MTTDLARWNLLDYQLQLDSKTEPRMAKAKNYTAHTIGVEKKHILGGGDTTHTLLMGGTIWVGTPHTLQTPSIHFPDSL